MVLAYNRQMDTITRNVADIDAHDREAIEHVIGSGTTAVVAKKLGRKYLGIDCSEEYCAIAKERISGDSGLRQKKLAL